MQVESVGEIQAEPRRGNRAFDDVGILDRD
jgi:hypothetical protein